MNYYIVSVIGDGTRENPYKPNIPEGIDYVGTLGGNNTYLIATNKILNQPFADISAFCNEHNIDIDNILKWSLGD